MVRRYSSVGILVAANATKRKVFDPPIKDQPKISVAESLGELFCGLEHPAQITALREFHSSYGKGRQTQTNARQRDFLRRFVPRIPKTVWSCSISARVCVTAPISWPP